MKWWTKWGLTCYYGITQVVLFTRFGEIFQFSVAQLQFTTLVRIVQDLLQRTSQLTLDVSVYILNQHCHDAWQKRGRDTTFSSLFTAVFLSQHDVRQGRGVYAKEGALPSPIDMRACDHHADRQPNIVIPEKKHFTTIPTFLRAHDFF
jgi:hypothetical protein